MPSWSSGVSQGETGPLGVSGVVGWKAWVGSNRATLDLLLDDIDKVSDGGIAVRAFLLDPVLVWCRLVACLAGRLTGGVLTEAVRLKASKMSPRFVGTIAWSFAVAGPGVVGGGVSGGPGDAARSLIFAVVTFSAHMNQTARCL